MSDEAELVSGRRARPDGRAPSYTYDCFISYSHHDRRVSAGIQKGLTHIGRRLGRLNALRVFRDATDLTASPDLWGKVTEAMDRARFLIVVLSPHAAGSKWVDREVTHWLEHRGPEQVMLVVAEGSLTWDEDSLRFDPVRSDAAVPALGRPGTFTSEPFYVDVSEDAPWDPRAPLFREKVTDLAAPIHGKPKYELASDDLREQRRYRRLRLSAVVSLVLLTIGALAASGVAIEQRREAIRQRNEATSLGLSAQSREVAESNPALALALAAEGAQITPLWQATSALIDARVVLATSAAQQLREPLRGHEGTVYSVSFSPTGDVVASSGADGSVRLWDSSSGKSVGEPLTGHTGNVWQVAFSHDGRLLASVDSYEARLWDADTGEPIGEPIGLPRSMWHALAFHPTTGQLAVAGEGFAWLLDPVTGTGRSLGPDPGTLTDLAFSPDGTRLAVVAGWRLDPEQPQGSGRGGFVEVRNLRAGSTPLSLVREGEDFTAAAFSPDGRLLATSSHQGTIRLWDVVTGRPIGRPLLGHTGHIYSVAFSPRGDLLASAGDDGTARLWDPLSRERVGDPIEHPGAVRSVSFSQDGSQLATACTDGAVRLWAVAEQSPLTRQLDDRAGPAAAIAFSPDGAALASGSEDGAIELWDPATGSAVRDPLLGHTDSVTSLAVSPDDGVLASGSDDGSVRLWDLATGSHVGDPISDFGWVFAVALSPDGSQLAVSSGPVSLWDAQTGEQIGRQIGGDFDTLVTSLAFSPTEALLATADSLHTSVRLWDPTTGREAGAPLTGHTGKVLAVAFSPDGQLLASGSEDGTVRLWDPATGKPVGPALAGHLDSVSVIAFSPDGNLLASGGADGLVQLWDPAEGEALGEPLRGHRNAINSIAFSPQGDLLASGSDDGTVLVWQPLWDAEAACRLARPFVTASQVRPFLPSGLSTNCRLE